MTIPLTLPLDDSRATLEAVGGKGASLARLSCAGLPVPAGFHITTAAYRTFVAENQIQPAILEILANVSPTHPAALEEASQKINSLFVACPIPSAVGEAIERAYIQLQGLSSVVAVRSSATAEDLPELSFAGQQETFLNISGLPTLLDRVRRCWASLWTTRAMAYRLQHNVDHETIALAVVVQVLMDADNAGILFTANPINGRRDEMVINAAWGLGEAIVSGKVTPDTLTIDKQTARVKETKIADKSVMTIRIKSTRSEDFEPGTTEQPVPDDRRKLATLTESQVVDLVNLAKQIEAIYGIPQDVEWCHAGKKLYILQSRPITSLPPAPLDWPRRDPKGIYMRGSLVDLLPDPLSPLFETMGIPAVVAGALKVASIITRSEAILSDEYFTSINHYAYMNSGFSSRTWRWILFHMLPAYPRMLRQLIPFWRYEVLPGYQHAVDRLGAAPLEERNLRQLWQDVQELNDAAMYYMSSLLFATMGASAGAEMLSTRVYERLVQKPGDAPAAVLLMGYDSLPILAEKSLFDISTYCSQHPDLREALVNQTGRQITAYYQISNPPQGVTHERWLEFCEKFTLHLNRYGYMIYQLDFMHPLPVNDPAPLFETLRMYLRGAGTNPHQRQQQVAAQREQAALAGLNRVKGFKRWAFKKSLHIGQVMSQVREDALADIGLGYPLLRRMLVELGRRLTPMGALEQADDIYWIKKTEIEDVVNCSDAHQPVLDYSECIKQRKEEWQGLKKITPPTMIPMKKKYMGFKMDLYTATAESDQSANLLKGNPTSAGKVTAPARVLHGAQDFDQMQPGEVLVAGTTTPAWTPLFAMASGVVTDIGGPLTHGSIVAREYGIPAVMGTGVATRRIHTGQVITVDGDQGTVTLHGTD